MKLARQKVGSSLCGLKVTELNPCLAAPCDPGDFNAPDPRSTPETEDSSIPATQQVVRDTVEMMSAIFQEIKRYECEIARQHKLANELGEVAQRLRLMATLQVEQTRRLEEKLKYYRKTKVHGWAYEEVFGSYDARLKVHKEFLGGEIDAYNDVDRGLADIM